MRVGLVCPYSLDVPGGVQSHVRGLAEALRERGHEVGVLAPGERRDVPAYVTTTGRTVAVPYNGSVARLTFGPVVAARTRRWLAEGDYDVLHLHEPATPSLSLLALWAADCPVVATHHTANHRSRALSASTTFLRPSLDKVAARIAVSEDARETQVRHGGGEPVVIPNGVSVAEIAGPTLRAQRAGSETVAFVGRLGEPRKGFALLAEAFAAVADERPGLRLVVVGADDADGRSAALLPVAMRDRVTFLGSVDDEVKHATLRSADVLVAPNTGGESFGIVLVEAMAAGAAVLASDLPAFRRLLDGGRHGALFPTGDVPALAAGLTALLDDPARRTRLTASARTAVGRYDWATVAEQVLRVYETVAVPSR